MKEVCMKHRMPEDHDCGGNFTKDSRMMNSKLVNPGGYNASKPVEQKEFHHSTGNNMGQSH